MPDKIPLKMLFRFKERLYDWCEADGHVDNKNIFLILSVEKIILLNSFNGEVSVGKNIKGVWRDFLNKRNIALMLVRRQMYNRVLSP